MKTNRPDGYTLAHSHILKTTLVLSALPLVLVACKSSDVRRDEPTTAAQSGTVSLPPVASGNRGSGVVTTDASGAPVQRKPSLNQLPPLSATPPVAVSAPAVPATASQPAPTTAPVASATQAPPIDPNFRAVPTEGADPTKQLRVKDDRIGNGPEVGRKSAVMIHYTGWLYDSTKPDLKGEQFDTSRKGSDPRAQLPFGFIMGANRVVKGMEEGIVGMRQGGRRTVIIPPHLGYGEKGGGPIPPNATMVFDIELIRIIQ